MLSATPSCAPVQLGAAEDARSSAAPSAPEDNLELPRAPRQLLQAFNKHKQPTNDPFFQHDDDPINGDKSESNNRKNKYKIIKFIEIYKFCNILIRQTLSYLKFRKF